MPRRIFLIVAIVLAVIVLGVASYFLFFRASPDVVIGDPTDPFGSAGSGDAPPSEAPQVLEGGIDFAGQAGTVVAPRLVRITDAPVAFGSVAIYIPEVPAATSTDGKVIPAEPADIEARFIERQSGNVYAYRAHARTLTRISNQTVPGVHEAVWLADGSRAFLRFLSDDTGAEHLETYSLPANGEGGYFLEQEISHIAATSSSAVMTLRSTGAGSIATIAAPDGSTPKTAFSSSLSDLVTSFFGRNYLATTKASASSDGYVFYVNATTGGMSRLIGPLRGLTALGSPTGTTLIYSYANRGALTMGLFDVASRTTVTLPIATIAEKCVFNARGTSAYCAIPKSVTGTVPDDWYQGVTAFSDRIWKIDVAGRVAVMLVDPTETGNVNIDAVSLAIDPTEDVLTFTNRRDGSLWAYDL